MRLKPCPACGSTRCTHGKPPRNRSYAEAQRRRAVIAAWIAVHGPWCPGYGSPPHWVAARSLTADHVTPRSAGGEHGPLVVLCRGCNTRRGQFMLKTGRGPDFSPRDRSPTPRPFPREIPRDLRETGAA